MTGEKILIVDDEKEIRELVVKYLKRENMNLFQAGNGLEALDWLRKEDFNLIVLDIMMDDIDGFEVLKILRGKEIYTPVIILSARREEYDKILGLGIGADDYVTKPFSPGELVARIKAQLRRDQLKNRIEKDSIEFSNLKLNLKDYSLNKNGDRIELSATEFKMLRVFFENPNQVLSKTQLAECVWGDYDEYYANSVMVYIRYLREKLEDDPKSPKYIMTVWGIGYKLVVHK